jgi:hypothetical protein
MTKITTNIFNIIVQIKSDKWILKTTIESLFYIRAREKKFVCITLVK